MDNDDLLNRLTEIRDQLRGGTFFASAPEAVSQDPYGRRRRAIQALITGGATPGERAAAEAAMGRVEAAEAEHAATMGRLDNEAAELGGYE